MSPGIDDSPSLKILNLSVVFVVCVCVCLCWELVSGVPVPRGKGIIECQIEYTYWTGGASASARNERAPAGYRSSRGCVCVSMLRCICCLVAWSTAERRFLDGRGAVEWCVAS